MQCSTYTVDSQWALSQYTTAIDLFLKMTIATFIFDCVIQDLTLVHFVWCLRWTKFLFQSFLVFHTHFPVMSASSGYFQCTAWWQGRHSQHTYFLSPESHQSAVAFHGCCFYITSSLQSHVWVIFFQISASCVFISQSVRDKTRWHLLYVAALLLPALLLWSVSSHPSAPSPTWRKCHPE